MQGVVTRLDWRNPHVYIYIDQVTETGEKVNWELEAPPPAVMRRMGWSKETLSPGEAISVTGNPHRDTETKSLLSQTIAQADKVLFDLATLISGANNYQEPEIGSDTFAGHWFTLFEMEQMIKFVMPTNMNLTEAGNASVTEFEEATMLPALNCVDSPAPMLMLFPDIKKVEVTENTITIRGAYEDTKRVIHLNTSTDNPGPSIQGYSIGTLEGETLEIETTHFSEHRAGNGAGLASSRDKTLLEWMTLTDEGKRIHYRYELNDPQYFAEPIAGEATWVYQPMAEYVSEVCNLENARKYTE